MRDHKYNITFNVRNITLILQNITAYFTGKIKIITLILIIIMLSFINITLYSSGIFYNINISALSYQGSAEIKFTFNPTLSINISSSDLVIDNLTPGTTSDSNIINVSVATNASHGYTLATIVGDSSHNNTNLTHTNGANTFSSIATNASLSSLITDNTWGYSYKLSNTTNWNNYSGLSNETSKTLINTDNQLTKPIDFKIAAKASPTQSSGVYTNTINFIAISKPIPKTIEDIVYMQTFGELLPTDLQTVKDSMEEEHAYTLKDARDEQDYTIAKLKDGKIWMTKNLNLAGCTTISCNTSDCENYAIPETQGWQSGGKLPESSKKGFTTNNYAYVYNTNNNTNNCSSPGCYSYYSWDAATLGSGREISTDNQNAPYSICPKGWHLPSTYNGTNSSTDFRALMIAYGGSESVQNYGSSMFNKIKAGTAPNFLLAHFYYNNVFDNGAYHFYWSSTSGSGSNKARTLGLDTGGVYSANDGTRYYGFAVRCLAR